MNKGGHVCVFILRGLLNGCNNILGLLWAFYFTLPMQQRANPTDYFTAFEPPHPCIDVSVLHKI